MYGVRETGLDDSTELSLLTLHNSGSYSFVFIRRHDIFFPRFFYVFRLKCYIYSVYQNNTIIIQVYKKYN